ncbi:hypothetical protein AAHA92_09740 [Salvia divinorum]|uniref:Aspartic peptidase DDI1-type domain-containing protein n=1 Tax=Salvia divinorum TaxID=28513 RepID=A0ABD1HSD2_SALDI
MEQVRDNINPRNEDLRGPLPQMDNPFFLDPEEGVENRGSSKKEKKEETKKRTPCECYDQGVQQTKSFPYRGETRKKKEDPALKLPPFSRFIKEFIAGKAKTDGKIVIEKNISAVIQKRKLPSNLGMFTLPITIGDVRIEHVMCDLGASINVLPLSVYLKLSGAKMVDTKVVIKLVDRSCIHPEGVLENVIVKIHNYLYPADFHVIKMAELMSAGSGRVLLGRPFLRTAKTIIDVSDGTICLDYHGEKYTFSIDKAMKKPMDMENLHSVDVIAPLVQEYLEEEFLQEIAGWCQGVETQGLSRPAALLRIEERGGIATNGGKQEAGKKKEKKTINRP